jgi:hypothetical protein
MSHVVIIIKPPAGGGLVATESGAQSQVSWSPDDALSPAQVFRRIERAEQKLTEIEAMLKRAPGGED